MTRHIAHVKSLVAVLIPMAALMRENLHLIDELLSEQQSLRGPRTAAAPDAEMRRFGRGELSREIESVAQRFETVSAPAVLGELRTLGVGVNQNRPESSVGNVLRRLTRAGVLKEVKRGSGRNPAAYKFVDPKQMSLWGREQ